MKSFVVFLGLFALVCAAPLEQQPGEIDPELTAGYFEGDMVLDEQQGRNGMTNTNYRWPNNTVYYKFSAGYFDEEHKDFILRGMRIIEGISCIRFKEATAADQYYSTITGKDDGCYSSVGYLKRASQSYNLAIYPVDTGCFRMATVVHEWLHTLGFYHMQSDSHRDDYVRIATENIESGKANNFNKYSASAVTDYGEEYDYGSVMHYGAYAFSKNGEKTIIALQDIAEDVMGQRVGMSEKDIIKLNTMYKCPLPIVN